MKSIFTKENTKDIYPLSPMQEGMFFHYKLDGSSPAYFEQTSFRISGSLRPDWLEKALLQLSRRHDILRTIFLGKTGKRLLQVVLKEAPVDFTFRDIRGEADKETYVEQFRQSDRERSFNIEQEPPMRVTVLQLENEVYELVWSFHHILMDGWCLSIIIADFLAAYSALDQTPPHHPPPAASYRTYINWLQKQDKNESASYWSKYLQAYDEPAVIPAKTSGSVTRYNGAKSIFTVDEATTHTLQAVAMESGVTVNILMQALWGIVLNRANGKLDAVFGGVVSGRPAAIQGIESMVGLFINTVPVRVNIEDNPTFANVFSSLRENAAAGEAHHYFPLAEIQAEHPLKGRLFDHIIVFENYPLEKQLNKMGQKDDSNPLGWEISGVHSFEQTNYDFIIVVLPGKTLTVRFQYNAHRYRKERVDTFARLLETAIYQLADQPAAAILDLAVEELTMLSERERETILESFNDTAIDYPKDKSIVQLFRQQVEKWGERTALIGIGDAAPHTEPFSLSYLQLDTHSDRVAELLQQKGALPGDIIGISGERAPAMVAGIIGILKAGAIYLPLDTDYPQERIAFMKRDCNTKIHINAAPKTNGITVHENTPGQKDGRETEIHLDAEFFQSTGTMAPADAPSVPDQNATHRPRHMGAYIMYTSGSTGLPKGVLVSHQNIVRLVKNIGYLPLNENTRMLQTGTPVFDAVTFEMWAPLLNGGSLGIAHKEVFIDAAMLATVLQRFQVNTLFLTTSLFNRLVQQGAEIFITLDYLLMGGDVLSPPHINRAKERCPGLKIFNCYGPTENAAYSTVYPITQKARGAIPIGRPVPNSTAYVLDNNRNILPIGLPGELYVGGDGVAPGYINNPELTAESFDAAACLRRLSEGQRGALYPTPRGGALGTPMALRAVSNELPRLYKTGDLARWLPDGNIEFIGRVDQQVKIRGFRIECGEIENRLLTHQAVKEALVVDLKNESGDKFLCAYFVPATHIEDPAYLLRHHLETRLPDYMIPSYFMPLQTIPLKPNGKIDKHALPAPIITASANYIAPQNDTEKQLVTLWAETLAIKEEIISTRTSFFQLGGHSLKATILAAKIHQTFKTKLPLRDLFSFPTIKEQAQRIHTKEADIHVSIQPIEKREYYPLSPAQKRMAFLQQMEPQSTTYNIPLEIELGKNIEPHKIEAVLNQLIARHESLRTSFITLNNKTYQKITDLVEFILEHIDAAEPPEAQHFVRPFDLTRAPLMRSALVRHADGSTTWLLDIHHIISDGTSQELMTADFFALYNDRNLTPLPLQYKEYCLWWSRRLESDELKKQQKYWLDLYSAEIPRLLLPADFKRPEVFSFRGATCNFQLPGETARPFIELTRQLDGTLYIAILAVLNILFYKYSGQKDIIIGSPTAGRPHADLQRIMGMFVNTLA
ncbi:MAG: amino acid adenylation domain-containing protein, partial [bacterium]|nr:amino acid adenylation domain-containing protein [bacterium]